MTSRQVSAASVLRKAGVVDPERAADQIRQIVEIAGVTIDDVPGALARLADPDLAVLQMLRLAESAREAGTLPTLLALRETVPGARLAAVLGGSAALGDFLVRHPEYVADVADDAGGLAATGAEVRAALLEAVGADPSGEAPVAAVTGSAGVDAMRVAYRRQLLKVAAADLSSPEPTAIMPAVSAALADLADAALETGLALARADEPDYAIARLCVIAMGKTGAQELNYISDVDVIYVAEPAAGADKEQAMRVATRLAAAGARACDKASAEAALWQVDANLRPEGRDGPLVRDVEAHKAYYDRWASTWEFQALLKARPAAGDMEVGRDYIRALAPMVWQASARENFVQDAQAMRRRVEEHVPDHESDRQIKLGPGGLRDVEFTVQLLQLVHGRADKTLHIATTLDALAALRAGGYVGRVEADRLAEAYRQLRVFEHRIQLYKMRRTHLMPDAEDDLRRLARAARVGSAEDLLKLWTVIKRDVRVMHLDMFYRPLLPVVAGLSADEASLDPAAARERLSALGFLDPEAAQRHIAALTDGVSRRAAIQRQLLPAMISWLAAGPDPDAGLLAFRNLSEQLKDAAWYLKLLRDSRNAAERLARLLSTSAYVTNALMASADDISWLDNDEDLAPRDVERLRAEADAILTRSDDRDQCIMALRGLRRRELVRAGAADVLGIIDSVQAAITVTQAADVIIEGALRIALVEAARQAGLESLPMSMAVIAMGRYGGMEMSYPSDADVMFVYEPHDGADPVACDAWAQKVAGETRQYLQKGGAQPPLEMDADLRPEGKAGPLARSFESYREYYGRWSEPWEAQALLRARAAAGDLALRQRFEAMIDDVRYPEVVTDAALRQMRTLKARMESERLPRGIEPRRHVKLGPGGLADVEWTVQLLQLRHARRIPGLRTPLTLPALAAATEAELLSAEDAAILERAWRAATRMRGAIALRGRARAKINIIPSDMRELHVIAGIIGDGLSGAETDDQYARAARRARSVTERIFFGWEERS